jgi:uncharacterized iron-regulated membrane protein
MSLRQLVLVTHRWLGLASAAVLAIVGVTGVVLLWAPDIPYLGRYASSLHQRLALGPPGRFVVLTITGLAVLLELGGLVLWWRRKTLSLRRGSSLRAICVDLHHLVGVVFLPLMLILAATGFGMQFVPSDSPALGRVVMKLHTGRFPFPINALYTIATLGFLVQGATGLVMWWRGSYLGTTPSTR